MPESSMNTPYYYCYVSGLVLLGFADASFEAFNPNSRNMTMRILQY